MLSIIERAIVGSMTAPAPASVLPFGRPLTRADLDKLPDDGHRYELIDGTLVVTPAPSPEHQGVLFNLVLLLAPGCPDDLRIRFAPLDVAIADDTVMQPDLLIAPQAAFTARDLPEAPLLVVEVLSPSTRRIDLMLKRSRYEAAGCRSYWVIDPQVPSITAWELLDGSYALAGEAAGDQLLELSLPYEVKIVPAELLR